ncbi:class I SAM-dependent methyltransferase [Thiosulfativibrio zosterae]|uniref:Methyltransferase n=1 Tax=Thiosulfativibrio zosterae TaxID=2675053 RepID=A0A6F8PP80_9GAMM|nr:class I SAM-dependent methyltransferase [Thiosulfativibrio zosterae]BBP43854.1 methyltransferase [Thiosulfativibrio zosterae]
MALTEKQRLRIQARHKYSIERYGYEPSALFWSSKEIQELRFQVILNAIAEFSDVTQSLKLLDVGCGFGDFNAYALKNACEFEYVGIDVSPDMVAASQLKYPGLVTFNGEIFDFNWPDNSFDWVILSGALNEVVDDSGKYAHSVIKQMLRFAKQGVVFNLLNRNEAWIASRPDLQSFYPHDMTVFCDSLANEVICIEDYLPNDFTMVLLKDL